MKTWRDVWEYLCSKRRGYDLSRYYQKGLNESELGFWNGVLTVLEANEFVTMEDAKNIWNEIVNA